MKVNKADLLKTLKQDLSSAKDMKATIDQRVAERRDIYNGKLYGNEEEGKSKIVVKLAKRQSEWGQRCRSQHWSAKQSYWGWQCS